MQFWYIFSRACRCLRFFCVAYCGWEREGSIEGDTNMEREEIEWSEKNNETYYNSKHMSVSHLTYVISKNALYSEEVEDNYKL